MGLGAGAIRQKRAKGLDFRRHEIGEGANAGCVLHVAVHEQVAGQHYSDVIDEPDKVAQFAKELELNYPALVGGYGAVELSKTLGNQLGALPFTVVIDRTGAVVRTQLGPFKSDKLRATIRNLL